MRTYKDGAIKRLIKFECCLLFNLVFQNALATVQTISMVKKNASSNRSMQLRNRCCGNRVRAAFKKSKVSIFYLYTLIFNEDITCMFKK